MSQTPETAEPAADPAAGPAAGPPAGSTARDPIAEAISAGYQFEGPALELGGLMELVAPAIHALAPMTLADSDLDPSMQLTEADIPPAFFRV